MSIESNAWVFRNLLIFYQYYQIKKTCNLKGFHQFNRNTSWNNYSMVFRKTDAKWISTIQVSLWEQQRTYTALNENSLQYLLLYNHISFALARIVLITALPTSRFSWAVQRFNTSKSSLTTLLNFLIILTSLTNKYTKTITTTKIMTNETQLGASN